MTESHPHRDNLDPGLCSRLLIYQAETGRLFWRHRPLELCPNRALQKSFNSQFAGKEAFTASDGRYRVGSIYQKIHRAHRICWALHYGYWPENVDHVDGDGHNNRISNLRNVTQAENLRNTALRSDNTSGHVGVHREGARWVATVRVAGKTLYLGSYASIDDAAAIATQARADLGYHPNHGRVPYPP